MKIEVISVEEINSSVKTKDINVTYLSEFIASLGMNLYYFSEVEDIKTKFKPSLVKALNRSDVIVITGGSNSEEDYLIREMVAHVMDIELVADISLLSGFKDKLENLGGEISNLQLRRTFVPESNYGFPLISEESSFLGAVFEKEGKSVICLPADFKDMKWIIENKVSLYLRSLNTKKFGEDFISFSKWIHTVGISEARIEEIIYKLIEADMNLGIDTYAEDEECHIRITSKAQTLNKAKHEVLKLEKKLQEAAGLYIYGTDSDTMESVVGSMAIKKSFKLSCAESCTAGLLAAALTKFPESSNYFECGCIVYSEEAKEKVLGISKDIILEYGSVSEEVTKEMALETLKKTNTDLAVAVTGIPGPDGGSQYEPIGLVYVVVVSKSFILSKKFNFIGDRDYIRTRAVKAALNMLRIFILNNK